TGIHTIDTHYLDRPELAAAYLIVAGERAAFVDNNTNDAVPERRRLCFEEQGLTPEPGGLPDHHARASRPRRRNVEAGAGLSERNRRGPPARRTPRDRSPRSSGPALRRSTVKTSSSALYGTARSSRSARLRVQVMEDDQTLRFGSRELRFCLHTRGHANHHFCIADSASDAIFAGDAFGLALSGPAG
ncbi:MAG: hypothetical protein U5L08_13035, partial [Xanthomonadales bacterium]|nr:hypothetical protein [Xanthomonadales bacterium]